MAGGMGGLFCAKISDQKDTKHGKMYKTANHGTVTPHVNQSIAVKPRFSCATCPQSWEQFCAEWASARGIDWVTL